MKKIKEVTIIQKTLSGEEICRYSSINEVEKSTKFLHGGVSRSISKGVPYRGFMWERITNGYVKQVYGPKQLLDIIDDVVADYTTRQKLKERLGLK